MERTLKIFIACALGAGIGAFVALQLNQYLWWLGIIVGGIIGYLSYDFKEVIEATSKAYMAVKGWKPKKENVLAVVYLVVWGSSWALPIFIASSSKFSAMLVPLMSLWMICFMLAIIFSAPKAFSSEEFDKRTLYLLKFWNPLSFTFFLSIFLRFAGRFLKQLFLLLHSDIRLLCGIDAAIGAGIGYSAGNAIVGAIAGGIFGVINYKIISQKILKLHLKTNH